MTDEFKTEDDLIAYLVATGGCDPEDARLIIRNMTAWRGEYGDRKMTPETCWYKIAEFGFLDASAKSGWITPEGRMHSAHYGAHERLLTWMGLETSDVEEAGWARVSMNGWQCRYRMTKPQRARLELCGHRVDAGAERLKPVRPTEDPAQPRP